jgi:hypothetical protein
MGASAQPRQQPVYYDTEQGQYYTIKPKEYNSIFNVISSNRPRYDSPKYMNNPANRNYLGSSLTNQNRFMPKEIAPQYPEMNMLFPNLNAGLVQGLISSAQPDGAMYGAGRFLAPQTNNTAPQTTNTQGK